MSVVAASPGWQVAICWDNGSETLHPIIAWELWTSNSDEEVSGGNPVYLLNDDATDCVGTDTSGGDVAQVRVVPPAGVALHQVMGATR